MPPQIKQPGPSIDLIVPAFNEESTLAGHLAELRERLVRDSRPWRLLVVDDGSRDGTAAVAERFAAHDGATTILRHAGNRGLGAALRTGFAAVTGDAVVTLDADLSYAPDVAVRLVDRLFETGADLVAASPYGPGGTVDGVPRGRLVLSRAANRLLAASLGGRLTTPTSMARAYSRRAARELRFEASGPEAILEIVADALCRGWTVREIPARLAWRGDAAARASRTGWTALARQIVSVVRWSRRLRRATATSRRLAAASPRPSLEHGA